MGGGKCTEAVSSTGRITEEYATLGLYGLHTTEQDQYHYEYFTNIMRKVTDYKHS
jgi:hypothetical protein